MRPPQPEFPKAQRPPVAPMVSRSLEPLTVRLPFEFLTVILRTSAYSKDSAPLAAVRAVFVAESVVAREQSAAWLQLPV